MFENAANQFVRYAKKIFNMENESVSQKAIVVVDIGCRWGFAERFLSDDNKKLFKIYGFDPDEEECKRLQESYKNLPDGLVTCIPKGLAGASGIRDLYITKEPACSSLHPPINFLSKKYPALECIQIDKVVSVEVVTLSEWAKDNNVHYIDYIKVDTQGTELEILKGGDDLINTVRCIDIEVEFNPIYEGQSLFGETDVFLRSKGFVLWRLSNLVHYSLGADLLPINEKNSVCFDQNVRQEHEAFGGQLFWADAKYIHKDVLTARSIRARKYSKDLVLFNLLGMDDIVAHIKNIGFE